MPILKRVCKECGKPAKLKSEHYLPDFKTWFTILECGHFEYRPDSLAEVEAREAVYKSLDGLKEAYGFQKEGIEFVERAGFSALIADAMGLGKTIQALLLVRNHWAELTPAIAVVRGATIFQWAQEFHEWVSQEEVPYYVTDSKSPIPPGFPFYIVSQDLLARKGVAQKLASLRPKSIIVDESQFFKDTDAKRTHGLVELIEAAEIPHRIFLSGTPIKNRADEYFTVLNLLDPVRFSSPAKFRRTWGITNGRISPWMLPRFHEMTKNYIIRREKHEVLKHLPPFRRNFIYREIEDPALRALYNQELDLMENALRGGERLNTMSLLGYLARVRQATAIAKTPMVIDLAKEFLENVDEKLAIGIHHVAPRQAIVAGLREFGALSLSDELPHKKDEIKNLFKEDQHRVLVLNMLAGGVGLNLQFCANAIVLERQWNFSDERQFEDRFHRDGQISPVNVDYLLAAGTIDQYFTQLVERKRKMFQETVGDGEAYNFSSDENSIRELAEEVVSHRL